jgi:hypothetical protein
MVMNRLPFVVAALVALAIGMTSCTGSGTRGASTTASRSRAQPPSTAVSPSGRVAVGAGRVPGPARGVFVAVSERQQKLGLFDASTGGLVRWLLSEPYHAMMVEATAVDHRGRVWVTLTSGPVCTSGVAGCGPKPNSCAGEVIELNPSTGSMVTVLTATRGELIADAEPSPDGQLMAYLDGRCDRSYFNQYIRVRNLTTDASWTIGADLPPCHSLGSLSWVADGTQVVAAYGGSRVKSAGANYGFGGCLAPSAAGLTLVAALKSQPGMNGPTAPADPGCEIAAVTATSAGYAAIEGCGTGPTYGSGPVRLLRYSPQLRRTAQGSLGRCVDGAELRSDESGTVLLGSTYQFCNPPGKPGPKTIAFTDHGHGPDTFYAAPNRGEDAFRAISW